MRLVPRSRSRPSSEIGVVLPLGRTHAVAVVTQAIDQRPPNQFLVVDDKNGRCGQRSGIRGYDGRAPDARETSAARSVSSNGLSTTVNAPRSIARSANSRVPCAVMRIIR